MVLFLINAIYFNGQWQFAFKKENTKIDVLIGLYSGRYRRGAEERSNTNPMRQLPIMIFSFIQEWLM